MRTFYQHIDGIYPTEKVGACEFYDQRGFYTPLEAIVDLATARPKTAKALLRRLLGGSEILRVPELRDL